MTLRGKVLEFQKEVGDSKTLQPERAAEILVELTSLLGFVNDEIRKRDVEYNVKLLECYEKESKANRAKILAETSPEYIAKREARDTRELMIELIRSLKFFLKAERYEY
jgi:hypothetical protein